MWEENVNILKDNIKNNLKYGRDKLGHGFIIAVLIVSIMLSGCGSLNDYIDGYNNASSEGSSLNDNVELSHKSYQDSPYQVLSNNKPEFTKKQRRNTKVFEKYSRLDSLGRCGVAFANICQELMPDSERTGIGMIKPSGWQTAKYNGVVDGNYLYNRCHLIGFQLAGENANEKNLITGTRYMNVEGMLPFEDEVAAYVKKTDNHVLYRVTPVFKGKNLVAEGVKMEAYSVEDKGKGVCFNVFVYNVQPYITIDYANGNSRLSSDVKENGGSTDSKSKNANKNRKSTSKSTKYVINTNTGKFHLPSCSSVADTLAKNKKVFNGNREQLISDGYMPCKRCNP